MQSELDFTRMEMERAQTQILTLEHQRHDLEVCCLALQSTFHKQ